MKTSKPFTYLLLLCLPFLLGGCYSFTGTNISPDVQTISITNFSNAAGQGPSNLQQFVTEDFKDYFQRNTNLRILPQAGDLQIEGQIMSYTFSPAAIQRTDAPAGGNIGLDQAGANRLTIVIQISYTDTKNPTNNFDQSFSGFADFPPSLDINQISQAQIRQITERIIYSVFTKTVANW
ncbi:LPS assembly lipoprotein LptE [Rufibacter sp. XAAS-G3-1]|uniref:LPS assembly lipoprotein LptE n=1 Tax=Rufibacter sp. XAAS-G3-1 TaxID=2729134 RepID=UPI0015E7A37D|nr:LptE family protein [Rufibacter sp. XAAS-G3-1]